MLYTVVVKYVDIRRWVILTGMSRPSVWFMIAVRRFPCRTEGPTRCAQTADESTDCRFQIRNRSAYGHIGPK